jgi:hypothetical protein
MKQTSSLTFAALAAFLFTASIASAQDKPVVNVSVAGTSVTLGWTSVAGASGYRADLGTYSGGSNVFAGNVGPILGGTVSLGNNATYFFRITPIGAGTVSDEVSFNVGTPRPGMPQNFTAALNGSTLVFAWAAPASGGAPTNYVLQAGTQFNLSNLAPGIGVGNTLTFSVPNIGGVLPQGSYFARLVAVNGGGVSDPSDEVVFTIGNIPGVPTPAAAVVNGNSVTLSWTPPAGGAGVTAYGIEAAYGHYALLPPRGTVDANTTSFTAAGLVPGPYYWRVRAYNGNTPGGVFGTASFYVGNRPAMWNGPRTADPRIGRQLPRPTYGQAVAQSMASVYRGDLNNSCRELGGNNQWMFKVARELRRIDTRWGLNWKRGGVGDLSQDIVAYNWGSNPDEGTVDAYIYDIIGGHCGNSPDWFWNDVTGVTLNSGTTMRWTLQPYINAGFQP